MEHQDKYKMFKNFMFNELGITKEDIREWLKESVAEEAQKLVNNSFEKVNIESVIEKLIIEHDLFYGANIKSSILRYAAELLIKNLELKKKS